MTALTGTLSGFAVGDDVDIVQPVTGVPASTPLTKAWLTIKAAPADADPGIIQKVITTSNQAGIGQITDDGGGDGVGSLLFRLTATDTALLGANRVYRYDIQVKFSDGRVSTLEIGILQAARGITTATS